MSVIDHVSGMLLLRVARDAIAAHLQGGVPSEADPSLKGLTHNGVFVTLRNQGELRGCIGTFGSAGELVDVTREMARAALGDPRFADRPVSASEMADLRIELSVLSPLEAIEKATDFDYGTHGIYMKHGHATGCFLPDVGLDMGWDQEMFLSHLCAHKMGLKPDAWRSPDIDVWRFTVSKFIEK